MPGDLESIGDRAREPPTQMNSGSGLLVLYIFNICSLSSTKILTIDSSEQFWLSCAMQLVRPLLVNDSGKRFFNRWLSKYGKYKQ